MLSLQSACKFEMILKQKTNKQTNYSISWHENIEHLKPLGYLSFISEGTVLSLYFIQLYQNMNKTKFPSMKCLPPSSIELLWGGFFHLYTLFGGWHLSATADVWRSEDNSEAESISFLPCCVLQVSGLRASRWMPRSCFPSSHRERCSDRCMPLPQDFCFQGSSSNVQACTGGMLAHGGMLTHWASWLPSASFRQFYV